MTDTGGFTDADNDGRTPIERPLLRSDLNEVRDIVHRMDQMLVNWYAENKLWREQSDRLVARVVKLERQLWVPTIISVIAAALAVLARITP